MKKYQPEIGESLTEITPSEENIDIGWLAGIIEGEGSLGIYFSKRKNGKPFPLYTIAIVNTDERILGKIKRFYDRIGIYANINPKSAMGKKQCYELVVRRRADVERLVGIVEPFMIGYKKDKAQLMLEFFSKNPINTKKQDRSIFLRVTTERLAPVRDEATV